MSASRTTPERPGVASIVHPPFVRDRLTSLLSPERSAPVGAAGIEHDQQARAFERLRAGVAAVVPTLGPHPGLKGRVAFQIKRAVARAIYWYVDPLVARLRGSVLESVEVTETMAVEVAQHRVELAALRREVDALRRDLDRDNTSRRARSTETT